MKNEGFRISGFRACGFRVEGLGLKVFALGFENSGRAFRTKRSKPSATSSGTVAPRKVGP